MARRTHPHLVATRVTETDLALITAAAAIERVPVAELLRNIVVPNVRRIVSRAASGIAEEADLESQKDAA